MKQTKETQIKSNDLKMIKNNKGIILKNKEKLNTKKIMESSNSTQLLVNHPRQSQTERYEERIKQKKYLFEFDYEAEDFPDS